MKYARKYGDVKKGIAALVRDEIIVKTINKKLKIKFMKLNELIFSNMAFLDNYRSKSNTTESNDNRHAGGLSTRMERRHK